VCVWRGERERESFEGEGGTEGGGK
jgi:hypothetical protein